MTGYEPRTSGVRSDCSTNWTTPLPFLIQLFNPFKFGGKRSFKEAPMDSYATPKFVYDMTSGTDLIKILQRKFYATQFFKHSDWLLKFIN